MNRNRVFVALILMCTISACRYTVRSEKSQAVCAEAPKLCDVGEGGTAQTTPPSYRRCGEDDVTDKFSITRTTTTTEAACRAMLNDFYRRSCQGNNQPRNCPGPCPEGEACKQYGEAEGVTATNTGGTWECTSKNGACWCACQ